MNYSDELKIVWVTPMRTATRTCGVLQKIYNFDISSQHGYSDKKDKLDYTLILNIRNPYSRLASLFRIFLHNNKSYSIDFESWVRGIIKKEFTNTNMLRGYDFYLDKIIDNIGKIPDYYVRVEFLEKDLKSLPFVKNGDIDLSEYFENQIYNNCYEKEFGDVNDWRLLYTQELADLVYFGMEKQFTLFNYNKDYWKDGTP
jgi:hypothetical protein